VAHLTVTTADMTPEAVTDSILRFLHDHSAALAAEARQR
jgi:hypothetical protein